MPPEQDLIRDTNLRKAKALPAANSTNYTDAIDLISSSPGINARGYQYEIDVPALPALVDTKKATFTIQDSADGVNFTNVDTLAPLVLTGASGAGAAAVKKLYKLPENIRRYVRHSNNIENGGGDNTAKLVAASIVW